MSKTNHNSAFIDAQNLYLGVKASGWKLDYKKLLLYLKHKFEITKAYLFIGYVEENKYLYQQLENYGYELMFKPTISYIQNGKVMRKGNVDAKKQTTACSHSNKKLFSTFTTLGAVHHTLRKNKRVNKEKNGQTRPSVETLGVSGRGC